MQNIQKSIYSQIKKYRINFVKKLLDPGSKTVLDIGCQDLLLYELIKSQYQVTLADISPSTSLIKKEDIQNLSFSDQSFDTVLCQEVLEHVANPVKAISELTRVARKQLIISVPYEPFFTFWRFLIWEKEHLWAITPRLLKTYLGEPELEKKLFLKRYYLGIWKINK